jgi:hypothetical protein
MTKAPPFSHRRRFAMTKLWRVRPPAPMAPGHASRHQVRGRQIGASGLLMGYDRLVLDRLMKIKLDRLLFLLGVGLLVIGVGISVVVIVVGTIGFLLNLLG